MTETIAPAALAVRESGQVAAWTPSFAVSVDEAVAQVEAKHEFFRRVMRLGDHYAPPVGVTAKPGEPPPKPVLLKPGAELLLANMGLQKELTDAEAPTIDYGDDKREALIRYRKVCRIYRQIGLLPHERMLVAQSEGSCSSRETKYRYRNDQRVCPECGKPAIIKGKAEYGGGFLCFKKKDGCGAKFKDDEPAILSQVVGKVANPDVADLDNTILKMAEKRALVGATLLATGCSDIFTADIEQEPVIEGEFTETSHASVTVDAAVVNEIRVAATTLGFDSARLAKGISVMSEGTTEMLENLLPAQAGKLLFYLKREIEKMPKPEPCEACGATPGAAGTIEGHLRIAGKPCPNDTSEAADELRKVLARNEEVLYCMECGAQTSPPRDAIGHEPGCTLAEEPPF